MQRNPQVASTASLASVSSSSSAASAPARCKSLTRDFLLQHFRKHLASKLVGTGLEFGKPTGETLDAFLKRCTHLQLDGLRLTHAFPPAPTNDTALASARNCRVIYLHDNQLMQIDDFGFCADQLTHLYLQHNHIARMENLSHLHRLEKLYLGGNCIQRLEGFAKEEQQQPAPTSTEEGDSARPPPPTPFYLVELHMDGQRLPPGLGLQLSIPSMQALSYSLTILSLASNQMDSDAILPLSLLNSLEELNLSNNRIDDLALVSELCSYLPRLRQLDLRDNPINSGPAVTAVVLKQYRDEIIMASQSMQTLDGKEVTDNQREYLHKLVARKKGASKGRAAKRGSRPLTDQEREQAALHKPPSFPYAPKMLTLARGAPGAINVGAVGGMGARDQKSVARGGAAAQMGGAGGYPPYGYAAASSSPFLDEDPNLGPSGSASSAASEPNPLDDLLQTRGLVSAFQTGVSMEEADPQAAEEARVARANMNTLNQAQTGWDGGRTQHALPAVAAAGAHRRTGSTSSSHSRQASRPVSATRK